MVRVRSMLVVLVAATLVVAACSSDKSTSSGSGGSGGSGGASSSAALTASAKGITATDIKIGVAVVDFQCIAQFVDFNQGDAEKITNALVADLNKNGGIDGRQVKTVFKSLCPLKADDVAAACTSFTDDEQVFAVIGVYDPPPSDGSNQLCLAKDKNTPLIDETTTGTIIAGATPGLLLTPHISDSRGLAALFNLLKAQKTLTGHKVALLADQTNQESAQKTLDTFTKDTGLATGSTAVLTITNSDTTAAQGQLDSFIEKWKQEKVDTVVMAGLLVSAKQFVEKLKAAMPNLQLISDNSGVAEQGNDEVKAGKSPNPYEGLITLNGPNDDETFALPGVQACVKAYETQTGETVVAPKDLKPGADGKTAKAFQGIEDRCAELAILKQVLEKAGPNPTVDTWIKTVNTIGTFQLPTYPNASLTQGKYDAADSFRLATFDSSIPPAGDFKPQGPLQDVTK